MNKYITTHYGRQYGEPDVTVQGAFRAITDGDLFGDDYGEYAVTFDTLRGILSSVVMDIPAHRADDEYFRYFPAHHTDTLRNLLEDGFEVLHSNGYTAIIAGGALNDLASVNAALAHVYGEWTSPRGVESIYRIVEVGEG